ncbi:hypothetical protein D1AOALGA4SA_6822 [Olavius algarvensis Delta 1 endosymbiont]|nr:hypothetical protein D1AOALGA4SA_6822 [Olavius algarvensis Delta 1 endosymbiont]
MASAIGVKNVEIRPGPVRRLAPGAAIKIRNPKHETRNNFE